MILSGIFFGYYTLFLKNTIYHAYNRFYLLASMALSLVIPFFKLSMFTISEEQAAGAKQVLIYLSQLPASPVQEESIAWEIMVITSISSLFVCYLAYSVLRIFRLKAKNAKKQMGEFTFIETDLDEAPFSFFSNLFWKKSISMEDDNGQKMLQHELAHIREKHSWDRLFSQLICSIFWMNPFNWIIQKELQNIHEFIADRDAVGTGEVDAFAKMLLQSYYGNHFLNPSHSFYYSSIKRRIIMLTTSQAPTYAYLRKVAVLPLFAISLILISFQLSSQKPKPKKASGAQYLVTMRPDSTTFSDPKTGKKVFSVATRDMPPPPPPAAAPGAPTPPTPPDIKSIKVDTVEIRGTRNGKVVVVGSYYENTSPKDQANIVLTPFSGQKDKPLMVINGVIISDMNLNDINVNNIQSINILKGENAKTKYGEKGASGVIEITTKKP
jgi:TonB-dependent SusC/RagA subfamily outer membrane receptor